MLGNCILKASGDDLQLWSSSSSALHSPSTVRTYPCGGCVYELTSMLTCNSLRQQNSCARGLRPGLVKIDYRCQALWFSVTCSDPLCDDACLNCAAAGTINSLMGAISVPTTSFVLPAIAFNWYYRTDARRKASALPPYS